MTTGIIAALGISEDYLNGHLTIVSEDSKSNGNFILSCMIADYLKKDTGIVLVTLHNTFGHYHNVGMKIGYSLNATKESGNLYLIEPIKSIVNCILNEKSDTSIKTAEDKQAINYLSSNKEDIVKQLYFQIKDYLIKLSTKKSSVCIVIDDISSLLDLNIPCSDIICFVHYLRSLENEVQKVSFVIGGHNSNETDKLLLSNLSYMGDLCVSVSGLETGWSTDVSSVMRIKRAVNEVCGSRFKLEEYHIKLLDRQVKIFAPGMAVL